MPDSEPIPFAGCSRIGDGPLDPGSLVLLGVPDDSRSSFKRGSSLGPDRLRLAYDGNGYNSTTELGMDLRGRVVDLGNMALGPDPDPSGKTIRREAESLFKQGVVPFFIGGDHGISAPLVEAAAILKGQTLQVVQIDAHSDLYPDFDGDRFSHACAAFHWLQMDHVESVTQIGIRSLNSAQWETVERFRDRLRIIQPKDIGESIPEIPFTPGVPLYLSIDLDGLDPAFAPGVAHPLPGGLTPRQMFNWIHSLEVPILGADVVELNPSLDEGDRTAVLAARILHELMGKALMQRGEIPSFRL